MFDEFRKRREAAKAQHQAKVAVHDYPKRLAAWQAERDAEQALIDAATSPAAGNVEIVLHQGESCVGVLGNCGLVEERRGAGHYVGGSQGISVPIAKIGGRTVRYYVGAQRGHFDQGPMAQSVVATGTLYITNQRILFTGPTQTRECAFAKVVAVNRDDQTGTLTMAVSNRQKPTVVTYGPSVAGWVGFAVDLALARWRGDDATFIANLKSTLAAIDARKPQDPSAPPVAPSPSGGPAAPSATPPSA